MAITWLLLAHGAGTAAAQVPGLPLRAVQTGPGPGVSLEAGHSAGGRDIEGWTAGLSGDLSGHRLGGTATLALGDGQVAAGGGVRLRLIGANPGLGVHLLAGLGTWRRPRGLRERELRVPLGGAVSVGFRVGEVAVVGWAAPRGEIVRVRGGSQESEAALGLGVGFESPDGVGAFWAGELVMEDADYFRTTWSLGLRIARPRRISRRRMSP